MKTNKTYTTLVGAYTSAQKAGAKAFGADYYAYANKIDEILADTYKSVNARVFAKWNLAKWDKTLCALEEVSTTDGKVAYKWTVLGTFDSDGLLYPMSTPKQEDAPKTESKPKQTRVHGKGDNKPTKTPLQLELDTLAGTGDNSKAHKIMCKHGLKNSNADEYQKVWRGYWWTIR